MRKAIAIILVLLGGLAMLCHYSSEPRYKYRPITPDDARRALIKLVEDEELDGLDHILFMKVLDEVMTDPIERFPEGAISIGRFYCNLEKLTFGIGFGNAQFAFGWSGVFEFEKGVWIATITRSYIT